MWLFAMPYISIIVAVNVISVIKWFYSKEELRTYELGWSAVISFIPLLNIGLFCFNVIELKEQAKSKKGSKKVKKKIYKQKEKQAQHLIQEVCLKYEEIARRWKQNYLNEQSRIGEEKKISVRSYTYLLAKQFREVCEYAEKNIHLEEIKKIMLDQEMPFAYIDSVLEQHPEILKNPEEEISKKVRKLIADFVKQVKWVRSEETRKKEEENQLQRLEAERYYRELQEAEELSKKRIEQDLDNILVVRKIKA